MSTLLKRRNDYTPLLWVPKNVFLDFKIFKDYTLVSSNIIFHKNRDNEFKSNSFIELNGINLETISFQISYNDLPLHDINIEKYLINEELISIPIGKNIFKVNIL